MSVLIKGMDMPKDCWSCPMMKRFCGETLIDIKDSFIRLSNCPLAEIPTPHGRLIDANKLAKVIEDAMNREDYPLDEAVEILGEIYVAKTIIEAEE